MQNKNKHINTGFKTPENFFENFEDRITEQLHLKTETGFNVPDNYFKNVTEQIVNQSIKTTPVITLFSRKFKIYASSIAAAMVFGVFILLPKETEVNFDDVSYAAILDYADDEFSNTYDLFALDEIENQDIDDLSEVLIDENLVLDYLSDDETLEIDYNNL